jgi:hypothetical protein
MRHRPREHRVADDEVAWCELQIVVRTEPEVRVLVLGRRVDPVALIAAEGPLHVVARDDVLTERAAQRLEPVTKVPDDRKVADDRVLLLEPVANRESQEREDDRQQDPG